MDEHGAMANAPLLEALNPQAWKPLEALARAATAHMIVNPACQMENRL